MNVKTSAILFCTLLATSFAHDWLDGQKIHYFGRRLYANKESKNETIARNLPEAKHLLRSESDSDSLYWTTSNATLGITAIVNGSVLLALDTVNNKTGCFNGETGAAVIIDLSLQVGVYLAPGSEGCWNSSQKNVSEFLSLLVSLDLSGEEFDVSSAGDTILEVVASVLIKLDASAKVSIEASLDVAIDIVISISVDLIVLIVGSLEGILKLTEGLMIQLRADLLWLQTVLSAIARICVEIDLSILGLINLGVDLDLSVLLQLSTGAQVFVQLLLALSLSIDLSLLKNILNDHELLLELILDLGGGLKVGLDACIDVILHVILYVNANISLSVLNLVLLRVSVLAGADLDITAIVDALLSITDQQNTTYGNSGDLKTFTDFCQDLKDNTCKYGGVDISAIIVLLINSSLSSAIEIVVSILVVLSVILNINLGVSTLFYDCLVLVNTTVGVELLNKVFLNLDISVDVAASTNIVQSLLSGLTSLLASIVSGLLRSVVLILKSLTGIKVIFGDLNDAVTKCTSGSTSLALGLYASVSADILVQVKAYIRVALDLSSSIILI